MFFSLMPEIVVPAIMTVIRCAVIILMRGILAIGRPARNAGTILRQRCMSIMGQTNTTLKNWRTRQSSHQHAALNVKK
jgi:hypothetical protein